MIIVVVVLLLGRVSDACEWARVRFSEIIEPRLVSLVMAGRVVERTIERVVLLSVQILLVFALLLLVLFNWVVRVVWLWFVWDNIGLPCK